MNLKHFYYRGYFDGGVKLSQPAKSEDRKKNGEDNEKAFRLKNATLTSTERITPFSPAQLRKIEDLQELRLQVQNPGLLPGIGYPHEVGYAGEFKLGFGFDHVTGLPVLPGSSVKGVLRSVFPQFKLDAERPQHVEEDPKEEKRNLQSEKAKYIVSLLRRLGLSVPVESDLAEVKKLAHKVELAIFCGWDFSDLEKNARLPMSKHDVFFDALPVGFGNDRLLGRDALTPHTSGPLKNPIPLPFLKVMPGVSFGFSFRISNTKIGSLTITAGHKRRLFAEILCTVGAGAKTNVGYGQFDAEITADRIPKPANSVATAKTQPNPTHTAHAAQPTVTTASRLTKQQYSKSLVGKKVIGEVVSEMSENPVRFRILNLNGFEGERITKVPDSMAYKFKSGKHFELKVSKSNPERKELEVKVENFIPVA
jgi:CRISPR-associated protein Cmr6